jgi:hypothetical protein
VSHLVYSLLASASLSEILLYAQVLYELETELQKKVDGKFPEGRLLAVPNRDWIE